MGFSTNLLQGTGLRCVKKELMQLAHISDYEREFSYTDYVVVSAGVNDISRYGHTADSISSFICDKLRLWVTKYPDTVFIFNSILSTKFSWLNQRVYNVNKALFDLSLELYDKGNMFILDSHHSLMRSRLPSDSILSPKGNGIHISHDASRVIQRNIVDSIISFDSNDGQVMKVWPLRYEFRRSASAFHGWRSRSMTGGYGRC